MALALAVALAVLCRRRRHGWGRTMGQGLRRMTTPLGTPNSNPKLEPLTRIPNSNSHPGPMQGVLLSLFVFSPQSLPSGEVAMAPEPHLRRRPSEGVPGTLGFTLRLRWGLTAPSLPWLFASSRTKSVEAMVKRTEKINEKLSCHRDYCLHFHGTLLFRGKLRFN